MNFLQVLFIFLVFVTILSVFVLNFGDGFTNIINSTEFNEPSGRFNIFFLETRCPKDKLGYIQPRQACAIESAARFNPDWNIYVFFLNVTSFIEDPYWELILSLPNVHVSVIEAAEFAKGTPTESLLKKGLNTRKEWLIAHTADVLRYTTLFKYAGVYMDLDMILLKNLDKNVRNFIGLHEPIEDILAGAGAIGFGDDEIGRKIAKEVVEDVAQNYTGDDWSDNSVGKLTRAVQRLCETNFVDKALITGCHEFKLYPLEKFYSIPYYELDYYFDEGSFEEGMKKINNSIGTHLWNYLTVNMRAKKGSRTVICEVGKNSCPRTFDIDKLYCL